MLDERRHDSHELICTITAEKKPKGKMPRNSETLHILRFMTFPLHDNQYQEIVNFEKTNKRKIAYYIDTYQQLDSLIARTSYSTDPLSFSSAVSREQNLLERKNAEEALKFIDKWVEMFVGRRNMIKFKGYALLLSNHKIENIKKLPASDIFDRWGGDAKALMYFIRNLNQTESELLRKKNQQNTPHTERNLSLARLPIKDTQKLFKKLEVDIRGNLLLNQLVF